MRPQAFCATIGAVTAPSPAVRPMRDTDAEAAARLLGGVFAHDPVFAALLGGDPSSRVEPAVALYRVELSRADPGSVDVAEDPDGTFLGVGLWQSPREHPRLLTELLGLPRIVGALGLRGTLRGARHDLAVRRTRPPGDLWYLSSIAVSDAARGRGVGGLLLRTRLVTIDAQELPAALESTTAASRRLYERHGFEALARVRSLPGTSSTMMLRPAAHTR